MDTIIANWLWVKNRRILYFVYDRRTDLGRWVPASYLVNEQWTIPLLEFWKMPGRKQVFQAVECPFAASSATIEPPAFGRYISRAVLDEARRLVFQVHEPESQPESRGGPTNSAWVDGSQLDERWDQALEEYFKIAKMSAQTAEAAQLVRQRLGPTAEELAASYQVEDDAFPMSILKATERAVANARKGVYCYEMFHTADSQCQICWLGKGYCNRKVPE